MKVDMMLTRDGWKYIGAWERSPEKKRLHMHALLYIPPEQVEDFERYIEERNDFNFNEHKRTITHCHRKIEEKFGRNDFEPLNYKEECRMSIDYICKYIGKSKERLVFSRGLSQFFVSDVIKDDVICNYGETTAKKVLLSDEFSLWDEGVKIGKVSPENIERMPKSNR